VRKIYVTQNEQSQAFDFVETEFAILIVFGIFSRDREERGRRRDWGENPEANSASLWKTRSVSPLSNLNNYLATWSEGCSMNAAACVRGVVAVPSR